MLKSTRLILFLGLILKSMTTVIGQSKPKDFPILKVPNSNTPPKAVQKSFVSDDFISPNWKMKEKYLYDVLNEGEILLIDLATSAAHPKYDFDNLPQDTLSKIVFLSNDVSVDKVKKMGMDASINQMIDSLYRGNHNYQLVAIFPNKQVKYLNSWDIAQLPSLAKDKMHVLIRYDAYTKHIRCTDVNDAHIVLKVSEGAAPYTFKWSNGQMTDSIGSLARGTYICTITDARGNKTMTDTIKVNAPPKLDVHLSKKEETPSSEFTVKTLYTGGFSPLSFEWLKDSFTVANTKDVAHLKEGVYHLRVSDGLGCQYTYPLVLGQPADLKDKGLDYSAELYPNPSNGRITMALNDPLYNSDVEVIDDIGRKVHQSKVSTSLAVLDLSALSEGIYTIKMSNVLGIILKKIIIKK